MSKNKNVKDLTKLFESTVSESHDDFEYEVEDDFDGEFTAKKAKAKFDDEDYDFDADVEELVFEDDVADLDDGTLDDAVVVELEFDMKKDINEKTTLMPSWIDKQYEYNVLRSRLQAALSTVERTALDELYDDEDKSDLLQSLKVHKEKVKAGFHTFIDWAEETGAFKGKANKEDNAIIEAKVNTYEIYISNNKKGIPEKTKYLGDVEATSKEKAIEQAYYKDFKDDISIFHHVHGGWSHNKHGGVWAKLKEPEANKEVNLEGKTYRKDKDEDEASEKKDYSQFKKQKEKEKFKHLDESPNDTNLLKASEKALHNMEQLCDMVNFYSKKLGLGKKVNFEDWSDFLSDAIQAEKRK